MWRCIASLSRYIDNLEGRLSKSEILSEKSGSAPDEPANRKLRRDGRRQADSGSRSTPIGALEGAGMS